jgi:hypothetical protein
MRQSSNSAMPTLPSATIGLDGKAINLELACSYTTQQLISLQDWVKEISKTGQ